MNEALHDYDIALFDENDSIEIERTEMHGDGGIEIDSFGTLGTLGTGGGCFGSVGTAGCCC